MENQPSGCVLLDERIISALRAVYRKNWSARVATTGLALLSLQEAVLAGRGISSSAEAFKDPVYRIGTAYNDARPEEFPVELSDIRDDVLLMRDRLLPALLQKGDEVVAYALQCGDAGWLSRRKRRASLLDSANSFNGLLYDEIVPVASGLYRKNPYFREFHRRREGLDVREI